MKQIFRTKPFRDLNKVVECNGVDSIRWPDKSFRPYAFEACHEFRMRVGEYNNFERASLITYMEITGWGTARKRPNVYWVRTRIRAEMSKDLIDAFGPFNSPESITDDGFPWHYSWDDPKLIATTTKFWII